MTINSYKNKLIIVKGKYMKRKSLLKTLSQPMEEFFKVLWNFYKTLMRKIINSLKPVKVSY